MPTASSFPDVDIPNVDLWGLVFEGKRNFSDSQVIYRAADSSRYYTFANVKDTSMAFGQGLRNLWDWQKGDVFAIYAPNDIDYGPVIFGIFYAGGIISPASPAFSADELTYQLTNSSSKALITTKEGLPVALKAARKAGIPEDRVILMGADRDEQHVFKHWTSIRKTSGASRYRRRKMNPHDDLSFLVYSSGTTGLPKGVMLSHRNIAADLLMLQGAVGKWYSHGNDKFIGVLPFFHAYGLVALVFQSLHRGIETVVMKSFDMEKFLHTIQQHRVTTIYVAPPVVVRLARDKLVDEYDLSSVKMITCGAAPLTRELVDSVYKRLGIKINQAYGLSETSPMVHTQPWDEWYSSVGSVGKLFPNMIAKYMSEDGLELGAGETGELWLLGPNVFKGYWKNEEATRNSLTSDGYFKTGDVGFVDKDHNFYITDRVKELIKYKGLQVAPAELEGKLMDHPGINDVAVIGVNDEERHTEVPRAYVVPAAGKNGQQDAEDIVSWLQSRVANHKQLRGGVRFVKEIPKSASGKILRRLLKDRAKQEDAKNGKKSKL